MITLTLLLLPLIIGSNTHAAGMPQITQAAIEQASGMVTTAQKLNTPQAQRGRKPQYSREKAAKYGISLLRKQDAVMGQLLLEARLDPDYKPPTSPNLTADFYDTLLRKIKESPEFKAIEEESKLHPLMVAFKKEADRRILRDFQREGGYQLNYPDSEEARQVLFAKVLELEAKVETADIHEFYWEFSVVGKRAAVQKVKMNSFIGKRLLGIHLKLQKRLGLNTLATLMTTFTGQ